MDNSDELTSTTGAKDMSKTISAVMCEHGVIGGAPSSNLEERLAATILSLESKLEQAQEENATLEEENSKLRVMMVKLCVALKEAGNV